MSASIRLTAVMTHPVQYSAPWFRHIAARCPEIELTVLYATLPTPEQQGVGFDTEFSWDTAVTEGYQYRILRPPHPGASVHAGRFWGLDVPEIGAALRDSRPDVALIPGWHSITLLRALWSCRQKGIPTLYRGDTHLGSRPHGWRGVPWTLRTWLLLRLFDGYLSVGQRTRAYLRRFGIRPEKIFDSPHCVDNALFGTSAALYRVPAARAGVRAAWGLRSDDFVVLFVGKLEPGKRPLDVIRAINRLDRRVSALVVGAGGLEAAARSETERLGVRVAWAGFLNQSQLGRAYAAADCVVVSSARETWGLVVNEALAAGLPCVVSNGVGCAPDLITPGQTGEIYAAGDIAALATALERVRERCRAGHDWTPACVERAAAYSFDRATSGLLQACRAVTAGGPVPGRRDPARVPPRLIACCGGMVVVSGLERMTFELLRFLRERGALVHCIVNAWENHRIVVLAEQVGASWSVGSYRVGLRRRADPATLARLAWDIMMTSAGLLRDSWRIRPTHVLAPDFAAVLRNAPALLVLRAVGVDVVLWLHNAPAPGKFYRRLWRWAVNPFVVRLVCCSQDAERRLLAHGIPSRKVTMIVNALPARGATKDARPRDPRVIIYVGQIIPEKGLDLLLDAVGLLTGRGHAARLLVVGSMDGWVAPSYAGYRERLLERARAPDLAGRVEFLGWRDDVPTLLASAGIHCCPSRPEMLEGLPLVCIEAKQAGLPSVAFPVGPFPEIISHGADGWICKEVGAEALAEGIEYFLSDPARLERASSAARVSAARFSPERFADAWWGVFVTP